MIIQFSDSHCEMVIQVLGQDMKVTAVYIPALLGLHVCLAFPVLDPTLRYKLR